jgi:hypothetical protein
MLFSNANEVTQSSFMGTSSCSRVGLAEMIMGYFVQNVKTLRENKLLKSTDHRGNVRMMQPGFYRTSTKDHGWRRNSENLSISVEVNKIQG